MNRRASQYRCRTLRQRVSALEGDNARSHQDPAEAQKAREEQVREVSLDL